MLWTAQRLAGARIMLFSKAALQARLRYAGRLAVVSEEWKSFCKPSAPFPLSPVLFRFRFSRPACRSRLI
jgi:hypothetical protein